MKINTPHLCSCFLLTLLLGYQAAVAQTVSTYAGNIYIDLLDGHDTNSTFKSPYDVTMDRHGNIYVADFGNDAIRRISPGGDVRTFVTKQTVPALNGPAYLAVDSNDNVYYANRGGLFVGKITPAGVASVFAGTGAYGQLDTVSALATFAFIYGLLPGANGAIYVADAAKLRKIDSGKVTTVTGKATRGSADGPVAAATFGAIYSMVRDSSGNIFVLDGLNWKIRKISTAGIVSTVAGSGNYTSTDGTGTGASFSDFQDLVMDRATGIIYLTEQSSGKIRKVTPGGTVTTIAGGGFCGLVNGSGTNARFCGLSGIAMDTAGNLLIAETANDDIRMSSPAALVTTFAGNPYKACINGADRYNSSFLRPSGVAFDSSGNLYVSDQDNRRIRKITRSGAVSTFCGSGLPGNQTGTAQASSFIQPCDLAVNKKTGVVYVMDAGDSRIRAIDPMGNSSYFVGNGILGDIDGTGTAASIHPTGFMTMDTAGNLYFTASYYDVVKKVSPAGQVTTYANPRTNNLTGLAADKQGNIYVAHRLPDQGIQKIAANGAMSDIVTGLSGTIPGAMICDSKGKIYLASGSVFVFTDNGLETNFGGGGGYRDGPLNVAQLGQPAAFALDEHDTTYNMYIADRGNNLIRKISFPVIPAPSAIPVVKSSVSLGIVPNPCKGVFEIVVTGRKMERAADITVTDVAGRRVFAASTTGRNGSYHVDLSSLRLNAGTYFVTLANAEKKLAATLMLLP